MSRVLKMEGKTGISAVRSLSSAWDVVKDGQVVAPVAVDPELLALRQEREQLFRQIEQQASDMSELRKQADVAFRKGEAQGREIGVRETENQDAKRLARLEDSIERAMRQFSLALSELEGLAPLLARHGLAAMLGAVEDRAVLVDAIIAQQLKAVEAQAVVRVTVSTADFADAATLSGLAARVGVTAKLQADPTLKSGDCRITLMLGSLDVGVDQQWERLSALLQDMARSRGGC